MARAAVKAKALEIDGALVQSMVEGFESVIPGSGVAVIEVAEEMKAKRGRLLPPKAVEEEPASAPAAQTVRAAVLVPLSKLKRDPDNVRRGTKGDLEQLAADLLAHGQLQNLVVRGDGEEFGGEVSGGGFPGGYFVEAGDRRLRALQLLAKRGDIAKDYPVNVIVLAPGEAAREAGLAENFQRLAMGPADEARAFAEAVAAAGATEPEIIRIEGVARRFGVTVRHVRQRLRLAGLHPVVLEALAKGKISLDIAQAYASVPDAARQAKVFGELRGWDADNAASVRRAMQRAGYAADSDLAKFVGRDAYVAHGGSFAVDLFTDGDAEHWLDDAIVDRLAGEKLVEEAAKLQSRFGFHRVIPELTYGDRREAIAELTIAGNYTDWTQKPEAERAKLVVVAMINDAVAEIDHGAAWFAPGAAAPVIEREAPPPSSVRDDDPPPAPIGGGAPAEAVAPEPKGLPQSLKDALAMRRRDVLVHALTADSAASTAVAHDLAAFLMVDQVGDRWPKRELGSALQVNEIEDPVKPDADGKLPWGDDDLAASLDHAWSGGDAPLEETWLELTTPADRFAAFRALPTEDKARWLARGVAATLRAVPVPAPGMSMSVVRQARALHDEIAAQIGGIVPAEHWRPTASNFWDRAGKAACLAFIDDCAAKDFPWPVKPATMKKPELSALCEDLAAGNTGPLMAALKCGDRDPIMKRVAGRFAAWMPAEMLLGERRYDDE